MKEVDADPYEDYVFHVEGGKEIGAKIQRSSLDSFTHSIDCFVGDLFLIPYSKITLIRKVLKSNDEHI